jgi:hypothetical protein
LPEKLKFYKEDILYLGTYKAKCIEDHRNQITGICCKIVTMWRLPGLLGKLDERCEVVVNDM